MIEVLFFLNAAILLFLFNLLSKKIGRIIALTHLGYTGTFTVIKPALLYYFGLFFPYSTDDPDAVKSLLTGSLIFLTIQYIAIKLFSKRKAPVLALKLYDFDRANSKGIMFAFAVLMTVSYLGCLIKFGNAAYMISLVDAFEATSSLANGSWYLNYIADILFYGALMVISFTYWRHTAIRSLAIVIATLVITYFWVKMSSRTGALVVIVAWMSCYFSIARQRKINVLYIAAAGYALLVLLYVGNLLRSGSTDIDWNTAAFGAVFAAAADLAPVDNATLLYADMDKHESTRFLYLAGAALPTVLIPSSIFPLKIPADKDAELTRTFFPEGADTAFYHEDSTLTFTVPASGYADAGYFGLMIASALYALLMCWYIWIFRHGTRSSRFVGAYLIIVHTVGYRLSIETLLIAFYTSALFFLVTRAIAMAIGKSRASPSRRPPRLVSQKA